MYLINAVVLKHTPTALCEGGWGKDSQMAVCKSAKWLYENTRKLF